MYKKAIETLNGLQSNALTINALVKSGGKMNKTSLSEMNDWLIDLGHKINDVDSLGVIHVAGTKGKGSTCAFAASILRKSGLKVGLYTSPHLMAVRERIQINGKPISEDLFAKYFFEIYERLNERKRDRTLPAYFRFLTLMCFHTFICEKVDAAVIEVGVGGEYDCTNIIQRPICTGITHLALDHTHILGENIEEIAWHKAGILKAHAYAVSVQQDPRAQSVLKKRAAEKGVELDKVDVSAISNARLSLGGKHQFENAALATQLARHLLKMKYKKTISTSDCITALEETKWAGRCDKRIYNNVEWCIDGAHTTESLQAAVEWLAESENCPTTLIFNQQTRDAKKLLATLHAALRKHNIHIEEALFCTNEPFIDKSADDLKSVLSCPTDLQENLANEWERLHGKPGKILNTVEEAVKTINTKRVFVTGSLHLVGSVLTVLTSMNPEET